MLVVGAIDRASFRVIGDGRLAVSPAGANRALCYAVATMRVHRAPEPRLPVVLVTGLVAAVAGWVLVRATIGRAPAGASAEVETPTHTEPEASAAPDANADATAANEPNARPETSASAEVAPSEPEAAAQPDEEASATATPATAETSGTSGATPSATATGTTVRRGRVAYIRCGDTDRCPRDAALEDAAWAIVDALPSCARLAGQTGSADVRFHFEAETVEVRFRDHGDRPLAIPALRACLIGPSASLRTTLTPRPLTASFRFDLVAE